MKTNLELSLITAAARASAAHYQIYRQNRARQFLPGYRSDSAPEAVEAFLDQGPAFDGGGVRLIDHRDQRMVASVKWRTEKTDFGFPVLHRVNRFHDPMIEQLAYDELARETLQETIRHSLLIEG